MSKMSEKVAYLKGLAEGLGVSGESREDKLMLAVIDALEAFAQQGEETAQKLDEPVVASAAEQRVRDQKSPYEPLL